MNTFSIALFVFMLVVIGQQTAARYEKGLKSASSPNIFLNDLAKTINSLEDAKPSEMNANSRCCACPGGSCNCCSKMSGIGVCCDFLEAKTKENHLAKTSDDNHAD